MAEPVSLIMLQFLAWVADRPRTRADVMEAWRSTCPRLSVWEDSIIEGLVSLNSRGDVSLTPLGHSALAASRASAATTGGEIALGPRRAPPPRSRRSAPAPRFLQSPDRPSQPPPAARGR